jgi:hypothetical protein
MAAIITANSPGESDFSGSIDSSTSGSIISSSVS